ncbi:hypothetical protein BH10BAC1_BH10BAC1_15090 [soil metagenome]
MKAKQLLIFLSFLLVPTICSAEGQRGLEYILYGLSVIYVFIVWGGVSFILYYLIRWIRKKEYTKKEKNIIYFLAVVLAVLHWWRIVTHL